MDYTALVGGERATPVGRKKVTRASMAGVQSHAEASHKDLKMFNKDLRGPGLRAIFFHPLCLLLACFPLGIASSFCGWGAEPTFWLNFLALVPLAKILGDATEELDASLNDPMLSGLINASFGNAVEMIISISALRENLTGVVKMSLLGSIISNMLLVLGMSFFFGGILGRTGKTKSLHLERNITQSFQKEGTNENVTMLLLSSFSLTLVTIFSHYGHDEHTLSVSRIGSCILMTSYGCYLVFQLYTHRESFAAFAEEDENEEEDEGGADKAEEHHLSKWDSIALLCVTAVCTAVSSEFLVGAINGVVEGSSMNETFIGVILLPIVGNACEHMAAVRFAIEKKPNLTVGISIGSSTQIALFVFPFSVLVAWAMDVDMTLDLGSLHTMVLTLSVIVVMSVVMDGQTNWLEGWLLMSAYAYIAVLYWHPTEAIV